MDNEKTKDVLKETELERLRINKERLQDDAVIMGLLLVYAESIKQARPDKKAS